MNFRSIERGALESATLDKAYNKAERALEVDAINERDFEDLYGEDNVGRDLDYVARMEQRFARDATPNSERQKRLATIFEAIVHTQAELNEWLGENAYTINPSRFDDIKNGVDTLVEFRQPERAASQLALAIDVTYGQEIARKLERIRDDIDKGDEGELAHVRYFVSEHMGIRGELSDVPRVVVGTDARTVKELAELWLERDNDALYRHHVQLLMLDQIKIQLEAFRDYARAKDKADVARKYDQTLVIIDGILKEKKALRIEINWDNGSDETYSAMRRQLKTTFAA